MAPAAVLVSADDARRSAKDSWSGTAGSEKVRGPVTETSPGAAFSVCTATVSAPLAVFSASNRLTLSTRSCDYCLRLAYSQPARDAAEATERQTTTARNRAVGVIA